MTAAAAPPEAPTDRAAWIGLLARSAPERVAHLWAALGPEPEFAWLRRPETGTVMLRGRAGAVGAPFNLGEVTVTRASVRLAGGAVGHAMVQGRDAAHARIAALADALLQGPGAARLRTGLLDPLAQAEAQAREARAARAAATRVDFFTLVRGDG